MDYIALMKESYARACNRKISDMNITGYFNFNMAQYVPNKMSELILEYDLTQLIIYNNKNVIYMIYKI